MHGPAHRLDVRSCGYGAMAVVVLKIAFLRLFGLENTKTCLILDLAYIFELPMCSALGIAITKCPTKGLSKKLSSERDIARAPESAGKWSGVASRQTPVKTGDTTRRLRLRYLLSTSLACTSRPTATLYPDDVSSIFTIQCPSNSWRFCIGRSSF